MSEKTSENSTRKLLRGLSLHWQQSRKVGLLMAGGVFNRGRYCAAISEAV